MRWIIAILILGLLVFIHEMGHFLIAKINGVDVLEFSIGFGPRLASFKYKGTRYSLKALPFGGSCLMKGMYPEEDEAYLSEEAGEEISLAEIDEEGSFQNASLGRRASIVVAGPIFNFLLAFVAAVIIISSIGYDPALIMTVREGSAAEAAGLEVGDTVTSYNGKRVVIGRDISAEMTFKELPDGASINMTVQRDGEEIAVSFVPDLIETYRFGFTYQPGDDKARVLEVSPGTPFAEAGIEAEDVIVSIDGTAVTTADSMNAYLEAHPLDGSPVSLVIDRGGASLEKTGTPAKVTYRDPGFDYNIGRTKTTAFGVLRYSFYEVKYWIVTTVRSIGLLFTGGVSVNDLSGPVGIVDIVGDTYEESREEGAFMTWLNLLNIMLFLSANLGVMNLLPIPAVDGGRLLFIIIEAVRGKPMNRKVESTVQLVAVMLLLILMVFVMYNDLTKLFN